MLAIGLAWWVARGGTKLEAARIIGPSMAPTFVGTHRFSITCADCGFPFSCDADDPPPRNAALCPNCGFLNELSALQRREGDSVGIDLAAYAFRSPARWDVVALQAPESEQKFNVKRIVGLPGESIAISDGDLYANGQLIRKSLAELKQLAIAVYDDRYRPAKTTGLPARWQGESSASRWQATSGGYSFNAARPSGRSDWLVYRHWNRVNAAEARAEESPVRDNDSYNQASSRELHAVRDLLFTCRLKVQGPGWFAVRIHDGREWFEARLFAERDEAVLFRGGNEFARTRLAPGTLQWETAIQFALCDQQVLLALGDRQVFRLPYMLPETPLIPLPHPVEIGAAEPFVSVGDLRVSRDIYYLSPRTVGGDWSADRRLAPNEFFVLGDNAPVSRDSRFWPAGSVTRHKLRGKVVRKDEGRRIKDE